MLLLLFRLSGWLAAVSVNGFKNDGSFLSATGGSRCSRVGPEKAWCYLGNLYGDTDVVTGSCWRSCKILAPTWGSVDGLCVVLTRAAVGLCINCWILTLYRITKYRMYFV